MSFKRLDPEDFLVSADSIVGPAWSNNAYFLTSFPTSTTQISSVSSQYYYNVYNSGLAEIQFAVAYGDSKGSGSSAYNASNPGLSPTRTVFGQFVNLLLGEDENASFDFGGPVANNEYFYAIVVNRARYKQSLMPGSFQLRFGAGAGATTYITDDSTLTAAVTYTNAGRRYTLGSGSYGDGIMPTGATQGVYGYLYPDVGVILLNAPAISAIAGGSVLPNRSPVAAANPQRLISVLNRFELQSQETVASDFVFCRARNAEFNYSVNPSFAVSASAGTVLYNDFVQNPSTYITSVGLYNDNNELLAVSKLSKPLRKDFTKEALVRIKLDF
jgi:hypothetical protein